MFEEVTGRVGVVVITLASHARGREFNPRIRYFSFSLFVAMELSNDGDVCYCMVLIGMV